MKRAPFITADRHLALVAGVVATALGMVLIADAYRGREAPWPLKLINPML